MSPAYQKPRKSLTQQPAQAGVGAGSGRDGKQLLDHPAVLQVHLHAQLDDARGTGGQAVAATGPVPLVGQVVDVELPGGLLAEQVVLVLDASAVERDTTQPGLVQVVDRPTARVIGAAVDGQTRGKVIQRIRQEEAAGVPGGVLGALAVVGVIEASGSRPRTAPRTALRR